jgi:hypothetical protein
MNEGLKQILDGLADKPPRSRLEPYREFIEELRGRGTTFRDIAGIMAEKCSIRVTASGIHDFLKRRALRSLKDVGQPRGKHSISKLPKPQVIGTSTLARKSHEHFAKGRRSWHN